MTQWIIFSLGSLLLIAISWKSLGEPRSHGFYRFFAWEAMLALLLINVSFWFYKPFAWNQIIAWSLLFLCLIPLAFGVQTLRRRGNPARQREDDSTLLAFEKTTTLVTSGIYQYIRHPLYSSLLLLTWGIFFKLPSFLGAALALTATAFLVATAKADETECIRFFGAPYQEYMKQTKRFVPYIFLL
ncbi:MAG TPA: methyltransferase [Anaerolineales bacterium]|nr:methyltransferase [Anaerolineales bacterium]